MIIDNSKANTFRTCPYKYFEKYVKNIEPKPFPGEGYSALEFGSRMHELLEEHAKGDVVIYSESPNAALEIEAQVMMAAYKAQYPAEEWNIVDVERTLLVQLPDSEHVYAFKIDLVVRSHATGKLSIIDHKTQERTSKSNLPQKWAARDQATLYIWGAGQYYKEEIENFIVDILMRQSPAGQKLASFPERQKLERTPKQIEIALRDIIFIADEISACEWMYGHEEPWPANREECYTWGQCDYYALHTYGDTDETAEIREHKYQKREEYLQIEGLEVVKAL